MAEPKPAGETIAHYRIEEKLGEGGMGVVYRAFDLTLERPVALKVLPADFSKDTGRRKRFEHEARAASAVNHGHVAHIYEVGESNGVCFIAMEYVEGDTLDRRMERRRLSVREVLDIGSQIADALDVAHAKGLTHRDIKPSNIMITPRGEAKLLDFGIAKSSAGAVNERSETVTTPGLVIGTVQYMSPEQALGKDIDYRSDIFSLGAVMYQALTGRVPFGGGTFTEILLNVVQAQPPKLEELVPSAPAELLRIIRKCMEKDRERRYQSTGDLVLDLRNLLHLEESQYVTAARTATVRPPVLTRRVWIGAGAGALGVGLGGAAWWSAHRGPVFGSIAVLPFVNSGGDPELEYLSDGLTDSIINGVSRVRGVTVVSHSSVFRFKGPQVDAQSAARQLHVRAVLTGRVSEKDGFLRVSAELVDARDNRHVWGNQYTRPASAAYTLQEEIAREVASQLSSKVTGEERQAAGKRYTDNVEAYKLYLKGRYQWNKRTVDGLRSAIDFFQQAIEKDPTYALAYAGMADSYMLLSNVMKPVEAFGKAKAAADRALAIDSSLAEPYATLGYIALHYDWKWREVEVSLKRSIELNPNYPTGHSIYARYLSAMGRYPQSVEEMRRAQELDPLAAGIGTGIGLCYYFARRYDAAIEQYRKVLETDARFPLALFDLGDAYTHARMFPQAFQTFERALAITPRDAGGLAQLGRAYAAGGRRKEALDVIARLQKLAGERYVSPYWFALVYSGLNDAPAVFRYLEQSYSERTSSLIFLNVEPAFDPVRGDPRFRALLVRMGLLK